MVFKSVLRKKNSYQNLLFYNTLRSDRGERNFSSRYREYYT